MAAIGQEAGAASAAGDGWPFDLIVDDVRVPDLLVCRPEYAEDVLACIRAAGSSLRT